MLREVRDVDRLERGDVIGVVRDLALRAVRPRERKVLARVPVGFALTNPLQARTLLAPSGEEIIALNVASTMMTSLLITSYLSFLTWAEEGAALSRDHPQMAFAETIVRLAIFQTTGDVHPLRGITTWNTPSIPAYDHYPYAISFMVQVFMLLHEYGHVVNGDLRTPTTVDFPAAPGLGAERTQYSDEQELRADRFALQRWLTVSSHELAWSVGVLLHFFAVCDAVRGTPSATHPEGNKRWAHLKPLLRRNGTTEKMNLYLDRVFGILHVLLPGLVQGVHAG